MLIRENFYKHYETIDDAAIAIFFSVDHNQVIDAPVVEKILELNPHLDISVEDLAQQAINYSERFLRRKDTLLKKLNSNRNVRNIARNIPTSISLTATTKIIVEEISMICCDFCQIHYQDLFTEDNIDSLIELIEDPTRLQNEFQTLVKFSCKYVREEKSRQQDKLELLDQLCIDMAVYLDNYLNKQDLSQPKTVIVDHLSEL